LYENQNGSTKSSIGLFLWSLIQIGQALWALLHRDMWTDMTKGRVIRGFRIFSLRIAPKI